MKLDNSTIEKLMSIILVIMFASISLQAQNNSRYEVTSRNYNIYYHVSGLIQSEHGLPLSGIYVEAFHKVVGSRPLSLGKDETDDNGNYAIDYTSKVVKYKLKKIDLWIQASSEKKVIEQSKLLIDAPPKARINLKVPVRSIISTFDKIRAKLEPFLRDDARKKLSKNNVRYFAKKLNLDYAEILMTLKLMGYQIVS